LTGKPSACARSQVMGFVIDADGKVYWSFVSPVGVNPGADGILSALEDLQNKQTVPATMEAK